MTASLLGRARAGARLARGLLSGDDQRRHRARAEVVARWRLGRWQRALAGLRRRHPRRPVVMIGLVEHLGDIVAAEPVARHLRRELPDALLVWPTRAAFRELAACHPAVDLTLDVGCLTEWMRIAHRVGFDRVVDLHLEGRSCAVCWWGHERVDGDRTVTVQNYYDHGSLLPVFARAAGLPPLHDAPRLHLDTAVHRRVDGILRAAGVPERFVVVHCTSNQEARDWRRECWPALAARLHDDLGVHVVEVGLAPVIPPGTAGVTSLCGALRVLETAEVVRRARVFVGIDSGPAHLANAAGTPGVVLLGRYRTYARYMPYTGGYADGETADVLQHDGPAADIPVETVLDRVARRLTLADLFMTPLPPPTARPRRTA